MVGRKGGRARRGGDVIAFQSPGGGASAVREKEAKQAGSLGCCGRDGAVDPRGALGIVGHQSGCPVAVVTDTAEQTMFSLPTCQLPASPCPGPSVSRDRMPVSPPARRQTLVF